MFNAHNQQMPHDQPLDSEDSMMPLFQQDISLTDLLKDVNESRSDDKRQSYQSSVAGQSMQSVVESHPDQNDAFTPVPFVSLMDPQSPFNFSFDDSPTTASNHLVGMTVQERSGFFNESDMIAYFFKEIEPYFPIIRKSAFIKSEIHRRSPFLLNSLLALTHWLMVRKSKISRPMPRGETYFSKAKRLLDAALSKPSLEVLQGLIFMIAYSKYDQMHLYSGLAIRVAHSLCLHQEVQTSGNLSRTEQEMRRRVMWLVYKLDREARLYGNVPPMIDEQDLKIRLPCNDDIWNMDYAESILANGESTERWAVINDPSYYVSSPPFQGIFAHKMILVCSPQTILICQFKIFDRVLKLSNRARTSKGTVGICDTIKTSRILECSLYQWYRSLPPNALLVESKSSIYSQSDLDLALLLMLYYMCLIRIQFPLLATANLDDIEMHDSFTISKRSISSLAQLTSAILEYGRVFPFINNLSEHALLEGGIAAAAMMRLSGSQSLKREFFESVCIFSRALDTGKNWNFGAHVAAIKLCQIKEASQEILTDSPSP